MQAESRPIVRATYTQLQAHPRLVFTLLASCSILISLLTTERLILISVNTTSLPVFLFPPIKKRPTPQNGSRRPDTRTSHATLRTARVKKRIASRASRDQIVRQVFAGLRGAHRMLKCNSHNFHDRFSFPTQRTTTRSSCLERRAAADSRRGRIRQDARHRASHRLHHR